MTKPELAISGTTVVLRGNFNPAIFQPAWFSAEKVLPQGETNSAKIDVISPQIASFSTEWLTFQTTQDRFLARTQLGHMELPLRDFVVATFRLLRHIPVRVMGLNWDAHYNMGSIEAWHEIGHALSPKEKWQGLLLDPGTRSLTIEGRRPDAYRGYIQVQLEPSNVIDHGLYVAINDHYELLSTEDTEQAPNGTDSTVIVGASKMIEAMEAVWEESSARSKAIMEGVSKFA
jgi:hypothetical protein